MDSAWLDAHWMPFTGNRQFKTNPRMIVGAEGAYYIDTNGKRVFDGLSGLWCCGLGHARKEIVEAVQKGVATLDYAPAFQSNNGGGLDGFLTKLNPTGSALLYSTYLGGNNTDEGSAVRVDDAGHAYVAGWAASTNFPELFNGFKISKPAVGFDG